MKLRRTPARLRAGVEGLEKRLCLASSVGWDGPGRGSAALTYYIGSAPASLGGPAVTAAIQTALHAWAAVADITFTQTSQPVRRASSGQAYCAVGGMAA